MNILFAAGGTAGHINPAISVAEYIKSRDPDAKISFIGTKRGMESRLVPAAGFEFYAINIAGFQRKLNLKNIGRNLSAVRKVFTA
ncbi:MAG: glycosyltransferase, partial [Oscillospiraceae bacterium]|nr:glycosyltransferase [Oscillospiraceae bacterium]